MDRADMIECINPHTEDTTFITNVCVINVNILKNTAELYNILSKRRCLARPKLTHFGVLIQSVWELGVGIY